MYSEDYLKRIGFTEFDHLDKSKRDSFKRLVSVVFVEKGCFTIRLILKDGNWDIEKFLFEGDEIVYQSYFKNTPDLSSIIEVLFPYSG